MKIKDWLRQSNIKLQEISLSPNKESELLICYVLSIPREAIILRQEDTIPSAKFIELEKLLKIRLNNTPLAYLIGKWHFYKHDFIVNTSTLIPRPETELLVEESLNITKNFLANSNNINILEIGLGTGCISISLISEISQLKFDSTKTITIFGSEISPKTFSIAVQNLKTILSPTIIKESPNQINAIVHSGNTKVQIFWGIGDVVNFETTKIQKSFNTINLDLVISNPPYIKTKELNKLQPEVQNEPILALDGGIDGIKVYEEIIKNTSHMLSSKGRILLEIDPPIVESLVNLQKELMGNQYEFVVKNDYSGLERFAKIQPRINN